MSTQKSKNPLESVISTQQINDYVKESLISAGAGRPAKVVATPVVKKSVVKMIKEALVTLPRTFLLKTERLSGTAKTVHENLYRAYVEAFNKVSIKLDTAHKEEANPNNSEFRNGKLDQTYNLNSVKLHELYFTNISCMDSEIATGAVPYMRFARDFGTFDNWQFDFMACAMSARNGWAVTVYEPYRDTYMNIVIDGHSAGIPLGAIPVLVLDMWEHAFRDYPDDKKAYISAMMQEFNWSVVEARMVVAERSSLPAIYQIAPIVNGQPEMMLTAADKAMNPPIPTNAPNAPGANVPPQPEAPWGAATYRE